MNWNNLLDQTIFVEEKYKSLSNIVGECNCHRCVDKRQNQLINDFEKMLFDYFPNDLLFWSISKYDMLDFIKYTGHTCDARNFYPRRIKYVMCIAERNAARIKKIPPNKLGRCSCCGSLVNTDMCKTANGKHYCKLCFEHFIVECEHCGDGRLASSMHCYRIIADITDDGEYVTKEVSICDKCTNDFRSCTNCGIMAHSSTGWINHMRLAGREDAHVCTHCADNAVTECRECGESYLCRNPWDDDRNTKLCDECIQYSRPLNNYGFKPIPRFTTHESLEKKYPIGNAPESILFTGIEYEVERVGEIKMYGDNLFNSLKKMMPPKFIYMKTDSSLDDGFEIVSQPFSRLWFRDNKRKWENIIKFLSHNGYGTKDTAGMHAHISKGAFTTFQLYKFINFIYSPKTRSLVLGISERKEDKLGYCHFSDSDVENTKKIAKKKANMCRDSHHAAVSLYPRSTVELRIFQTPKDFEGFCKNMEFIYAVYDFTLTCNNKGLNGTNFINFISDRKNRNKYPNLRKFIKNQTFSRYYRNLCI